MLFSFLPGGVNWSSCQESHTDPRGWVWLVLPLADQSVRSASRLRSLVGGFPSPGVKCRLVTFLLHASRVLQHGDLLWARCSPSQMEPRPRSRPESVLHLRILLRSAFCAGQRRKLQWFHQPPSQSAPFASRCLGQPVANSRSRLAATCSAESA